MDSILLKMQRRLSAQPTKVARLDRLDWQAVSVFTRSSRSVVWEMGEQSRQIVRKSLVWQGFCDSMEKIAKRANFTTTATRRFSIMCKQQCWTRSSADCRNGLNTGATSRLCTGKAWKPSKI